MRQKIVIIILFFTYYSGFASQGQIDHSSLLGNNSSTYDTSRLIKEASLGIQSNSLLSQSSSRSTGYQIQFTAGVLAGKTKIGNEYAMSFHLSNGFQFTNGFYLGVGCGAEQLVVPLIPTFGEITYHFLDNRFSPFIFLKSGYGFAFVEKDDRTYYYEDYFNDNPYNSKGGFLFNTGIGIVNYTWEKVAVVVAVGYRYQRVTETLRMWNGMQRELESNINSIEVKFGFLFR